MNKNYRSSERGSAGVKLVCLLIVFVLVGHAGCNYIPVAYQGETFKQEMQTAVVQGVALPGVNKTAVDSVKDKLKISMRANDVPVNAFLEVKQLNNVVQAHVIYSKQVNLLPFGIYVYNYQFDNTATPTGFLAKQ